MGAVTVVVLCAEGIVRGADVAGNHIRQFFVGGIDTGIQNGYFYALSAVAGIPCLCGIQYFMIPLAVVRTGIQIRVAVICRLGISVIVGPCGGKSGAFCCGSLYGIVHTGFGKAFIRIQFHEGNRTEVGNQCTVKCLCVLLRFFLRCRFY